MDLENETKSAKKLTTSGKRISFQPLTFFKSMNIWDMNLTTVHTSGSNGGHSLTPLPLTAIFSTIFWSFGSPSIWAQRSSWCSTLSACASTTLYPPLGWAKELWVATSKVAYRLKPISRWQKWSQNHIRRAHSTSSTILGINCGKSNSSF